MINITWIIVDVSLILEICVYMSMYGYVCVSACVFAYVHNEFI